MTDVCRNELFVLASLTNGTESGCSYKLKVLKKEDFTVRVKDISTFEISITVSLVWIMAGLGNRVFSLTKR